MTDIMDLARDVDRLFRARVDGRQMPSGKACILLDRTGLYERRLPRWIADLAEWRPKVLDGLLHGLEFSVEPTLIVAADKSLFRTRRHVAMLALTEPEHFRACLARAYEYCHATEGRAHDRRVAKAESDVARTAAYLVVLTDRLRVYRESEDARIAEEAKAEAARLAELAHQAGVDAEVERKRIADEQHAADMEDDAEFLVGVR